MARVVNIRKFQKGFTLIELIVVVVIIAATAGIIMIRVGNSGKDARNTRRAADMAQIAKAFEMYINSGGGLATSVTTPISCIWDDDSSTALRCDQNIFNVDSTGNYTKAYLTGSVYPSDPTGTDNYYMAYIDSINNQLTAKVLPSNGSGISSEFLANSTAIERDAKRIADLALINVALKKYRADNGYYPQSSCGWDCNGYKRSRDSSWNTLASDLASYISSLPKDPINSSCDPWNNNCYSYTYGNVGKTSYSPNEYDLTAQLEDTNHPQRCGVNNWKWYFANARTWCTAFGGVYSNQLYEASSL
ncbi:MAG: seg [candidate division CPR2 bacterium GW2011_GWC1_41_48]|uniref:Seg n=1 Tax=candidate division CPR2 bacterium GW2011_GWC1_41_48 TaxID=1618344 RepID=A0A0G0Z712_UNCC2|nr:MAG: hypothetical protein UT47_C0004G0091 [candidate division CPR2 bacterium GW2011_GWC2_39_35]KKR28649.1 MAG: hypothetical protein UT60_C0015G0003 [candidate division CPR2 bacterium GW2011_GWD2_39_7]KKR28787.1 MAG: hypothetical protein UT59_C0019G0008 [candidate division CPR2 bacterium GW2011_GWD1_39_7]KKS08818.1 MAG: seg [candidate division CPR2 bacterium GW2011_GWC1_41_48]OGB61402.1 MAG: hypothetical protein A2Y27_03310 [candidate division CPR2 bacterium GWD1_39_7]OGB72954.1 MAG: hypothe